MAVHVGRPQYTGDGHLSNDEKSYADRQGPNLNQEANDTRYRDGGVRRGPNPVGTLLVLETFGPVWRELVRPNQIRAGSCIQESDYRLHHSSGDANGRDELVVARLQETDIQRNNALYLS